ncbi:MAG TPA: TetR/AcrR family transcriptional regulator [Bordetella sp.]|jgi:AcrR family transcriptional regulator|nr:TetR/AcrR family transcriptional regulator [Bordetella sp.]
MASTTKSASAARSATPAKKTSARAGKAAPERNAAVAPSRRGTTTGASGAEAAKAAAEKKPRLRAAERQQQILHGAIRYFSEKGFAGHTRELSQRLGITQPLLYRYFKSKQDLIDQVYLHVFMGRWQPQWIALLRDRSLSLQERLVRFYREYARATYQPEWIRIYMFAGLESSGLNRRYLQLIKKDLLAPCCQELRHHCGVPDDTPISEQEIEFYWTLHDGLFYTAIRETIYQSPMEVPFDDKVRYAVENFLAGARTVYPRLVSEDAEARGAARQIKGRRPEPA